ncbi:unnamed protein product, partial [Urochloa humidicola]
PRQATLRPGAIEPSFPSPRIALAQLSVGGNRARAERMASRLLLRLRAGASAATQSARGHHCLAGRTGAPAMAPAAADAGSFSGGITTLQGARHYGTSSNHSVVEVNRATGKVQGRQDVLEKKGDIGHKGSVQKLLKKHGKDGSSGIKFEFERFANVIMVVGYGITFSVVMYYNFPWSSL